MAWKIYFTRIGAEGASEYSNKQTLLKCIDMLESYGGELVPGEFTVVTPWAEEVDAHAWLAEDD